MNNLRWEVTPNKAFPDLAFLYADAIEAELLKLMQRYAPVVENYMKQQAPWTDRTGLARQGMYTKVEYKPKQFIRMDLDHRMWYGKYLEYHHAGRFAIVLPTRDYYGPRIINEARRRLP